MREDWEKFYHESDDENISSAYTDLGWWTEEINESLDFLILKHLNLEDTETRKRQAAGIFSITISGFQ